MPRISAEQLDRLKQAVSLERLVAARGIVLKRHGADLIGLCPFHDDHEPSLVISPAKNLWHCLGACQAGGSVIDWVMKAEGVSFRHAVELLQADYAPSYSLAAGAAAPVKHSTVPKLPSTLETNTEDARLLAQVIDYYHQTLKQSPEALAYLEKRGIAHAEAIDQFKLGYANRTLGYRLPAKNRQEGAAIRGQLQRLGLYRSSGHEHFSGSLVIPVITEHGHISEVYGRKINDNLRQGTPKHLYLPGPHAGVWNAAALPASPEIILCEALLDALTFWVQGFRNVTASYGTSGFTADHLAAFKAHGIQRVLIAYDRDEAGDAAAEKLAGLLNDNGIDAFRLQFPAGLDANAYAVQTASPRQSLARVIRQAEWLGNGQAPTLTTAADPADPVEQLAKRSAVAAATTARKPATAEITASPATTDCPPPPAANPIDSQATPLPALPAAGVTVQPGDQELLIQRGDRTYRVRGLDRNTGHDQLKINLRVRTADAFHLDTLDLYSSKQRQVFINQASVELGVPDEVIKKDLGHVLLALEAHQAQQQQDRHAQPPEPEPEERQAALALLHDPELLNRILDDLTQVGVVGEETNKLAGYLACVSRHLDKPLAVLIQSSSAAGKSALMDALLALMPEDARVQYSALTGQSLFYLGETDLQHTILAIAEEEGAANASYALKLLQSEGAVTIASTGKDERSGQLVTREYTVKGPVMLLMTTTAIDIDEELLNRCLVLTVNESRAQTQAIHAAQRARRTLQGLQDRLAKARIIRRHHTAQRLLKPLYVINPYAAQLTFLDDKTRTRRDHEKYLTLIDSIALLHQYQREVKTLDHAGEAIAYVEVTLADIATANRLAHDMLGRSLDELPPQTRTLLTEIHRMVHAECERQGIAQCDYRFSRKTVRAFTQWSDGQLKIHCRRLEDLEYLLVHRGGRGQSLEYELLYSGTGDSRKTYMMGLLDVGQLQKKPAYDAQKSGAKRDKTGPSQAPVSPKSAPENSRQAAADGAYREDGQACHPNAYPVA